MWRPLALLLAFGGGMGLILALGTIAIEGGVSALTLAAFQNTIAGVCILAIVLARGGRVPLARRYLLFYAMSAVTGIAVPHAAMFLALPKLGAGLTAIAYLFPPLFTYALAWMFRLERFDGLRLGALLMGFLGTGFLVFPSGGLPEGVGGGWVLLAYLIPVSLAIGNVYRSLAWPGDTPVPVLSGAVLLCAGLLLWFAAAAFDQVTSLQTIEGEVWPAIVTALVAALAYLAFFELQRAAGPVYLSQSGYIVTLVGMGFGLFAFGETYGPGVWAGVALVLLGLFSVSLRQFVHLKSRR
jgi:drug/metabolite transporter (DMT)-like permease